MAVNLSPIWGAGAQLLDNSGNVLTGGKIYTYAAGTSTPAATFTSNTGATANSNPIILNSAGRVPYEIWLTDGTSYKFVLKDSNDTLIATYDNLSGINSNFIAYTLEQEIQTATAGQTVFNLTTMQYTPGTNNLSVYVDGVNQYGPGAQYAYVETDSDTVTFVSGLHVGASVKFTTAVPVNAGVTDAASVTYDPPFTGSVGTNVEAKLSQTVSVMDFGAAGDGITNDTTAFESASLASNYVYVPEGTYFLDDDVDVSKFYGPGNIKKSYSEFSINKLTNSSNYEILSTGRLGATALNPRASWTDGRYMYVVSMGSYTGLTQAYLHILDIENPCSVTLISSLALDIAYGEYRTVAVNKNFAYVQSVGGHCIVVDVSDKANPTVYTSFDLNSGNRQESIFYGDLLIIPKQTGDVDFYVVNTDASLQLKKTITAVGSWYQPIIDGDTLWVIGYTNGLSNNLLCIDLKDFNLITTTSSTTIATMINSRFGAIKGKYLFVGGYDLGTSKLNVIDISDSTSPTVVYTAATDNILQPIVAGNYLIDSFGIFDVTNPILPVKIKDVTTFGGTLTYVGNYIIGYVEGTGASGPSPTDGNYNPGVSAISVSGLSIDGITAGGGQFKNVYAETARVRGNADVGGLIVGPVGINTDGPITTNNSTNISGIRKNDIVSNKLARLIAGNISSPTVLCYLNQIDTICDLQVRIKYTHLLDISNVSTGQMSIGEVYGAFIVNASGTIYSKLAFADAITARDSGATSMPLTVTLTNGTGVGGTPVTVSVSSANMNLANSRASYEIEVLGNGRVWLSKY